MKPDNPKGASIPRCVTALIAGLVGLVAGLAYDRLMIGGAVFFIAALVLQAEARKDIDAASE